MEGCTVLFGLEDWVCTDSVLHTLVRTLKAIPVNIPGARLLVCMFVCVYLCICWQGPTDSEIQIRIQRAKNNQDNHKQEEPSWRFFGIKYQDLLYG